MDLQQYEAWVAEREARAAGLKTSEKQALAEALFLKDRGRVPKTGRELKAWFEVQKRRADRYGWPVYELLLERWNFEQQPAELRKRLKLIQGGKR